MNAEGEDGSLGEYALWNVGDITDSDGNFVRQFRDVKFSGRDRPTTSMEPWSEEYDFLASLLFIVLASLLEFVLFMEECRCLLPLCSWLFELVFGEFLLCILFAAFVKSLGLPRALALIWLPSFCVNLLAVAGEFNGLGI